MEKAFDFMDAKADAERKQQQNNPYAKPSIIPVSPQLIASKRR